MTAEPIAQAWTPACMEPGELAGWQEMRARSTAYKDRAARPCADCLHGFAAEMRADGRCNGSPGGVEEDTEMGTFDYTPERVDASAGQHEPAPRGLTIPRRVTLDIAAPPCAFCAHEPVCALRMAVEGLTTVETSAPPLPDGLRLSLTATVECSHFLRDKMKATPVRVLTSQERGQANGPGKNRLSPEARARLAAGNTARAEARRAAREGAAAG